MIQLNNQTILTPSDVKEETIPIQTDLMAVDGSLSRQRLNSKWQSTLTWDTIDPVNYRQIMGIISTGSGFMYYNDASAEVASSILTYSGMAMPPDVGSYVAGSSLNKPLSLVIRQL